MEHTGTRMAKEQRRYNSYLLRIWQVGNGNVPEWRLSLEETRTRERHGFANLAVLMAFLEQQMAQEHAQDPSLLSGDQTASG